MKRRPAFVVRQGSVNVVAYKSGNGRNQFTLCFRKHAGAGRSREVRTGEKAARTRALEIATALANGRAEIIELSNADRESYLRAKALLPDGIALHDAVEQFARAKDRLGNSSLADAIDAYQQIPKVNGSRATVRFVVDDFMRRKRTAMLNKDLSAVHIDGLAGVLEGTVSKKNPSTPRPSAFMRKFGDREIVSLGKDELQDLLNDHRDRKGVVVGPRRRRHIRECIVALWNDARDNRHLPQGSKHAAEMTARPKVVKEKEPTFEPDQFDILINAAHRDARQRELVPAFAIGAFGRMRMSEIARLDWSAVHLFKEIKDGQAGKIAGEIDVSGRVAGKTGMARIVEIPPNLAKWLTLYVRPHGHVLSPKITRIDNHVRRFAQKLGLKWKRNILRGSSTSYLYALTNDLKYVAAQHGTSERELKREYLERKTRSQADKWNAIVPHEGSNILELRWSVSA